MRVKLKVNHCEYCTACGATGHGSNKSTCPLFQAEIETTKNRRLALAKNLKTKATKLDTRAVKRLAGSYRSANKENS